MSEEKKRDIPKKAIPIFDESYLLKKGLLVTTAIEVFVARKDALFIKSGKNIEKVEKEVEKIAKSLGHPEFKSQIKKIIKWAADTYYEKERDHREDLELYIDFLKLLSDKKEIKIGKHWYTIPKELLD